MILPDANLLLYAYDTSSDRHPGARDWLEATFNGDEPVRLALTTLLAFVRIATHPTASQRPLRPAEAIEHVTRWLSLPAIDVAQPTARHWQVLSEMCTRGQARGPMVMDAHLAALAVEHGATIHTTDRDFARFPGVRFLNPLES